MTGGSVGVAEEPTGVPNVSVEIHIPNPLSRQRFIRGNDVKRPVDDGGR